MTDSTTGVADFDLLLIAVFCPADDLLPERAKKAKRSLTDAEVVTLCVAQAVLAIASDREFLAVAAKRLGHLFPALLSVGLSQAPPAAGGDDRLADRRVRRRQPPL
jgi:hypothetical protein